jgi:hypothetical protein
MIAVVVLLALSVVPTLFPKRTAQPPGPGGGTDPVEMREQDMFGVLWKWGGDSLSVLEKLLTRFTADRPEDRGDTGDAPDHERAPLHRYPSIDAPDRVVADREFAVMVSLGMNPARNSTRIDQGPANSEGALGLHLPVPDPGKDSWELDVILAAPNCVFRDGGNIGRLKLPRNGDSTPAPFFLRAKRDASTSHAVRLEATFWHKGVCLAKISREIFVEPNSSRERADDPEYPGPSPDSHGEADSRANRPQTSRSGTAAESAKVELQFNLRAADLSLFIRKGADSSHPSRASLTIHSPFLQPTYHDFELPDDLEPWLAQRYRALAMSGMRGVALQGPQDETGPEGRERTMAYLKGVGRELYQKFAPLPFKEAFCHLAATRGDQFTSIQILTNDPVMPWELMRPVCANTTLEEEFVGARFRVARWHVSTATSQFSRPPQSLALRQFVVIAPQYGSASALPGQTVERDRLQILPGFQPWQGTVSSVHRLLASLPEGVIHFAGHGVVAPDPRGLNEYRIRLEDGDLDPDTWRGFSATDPKSHPLVFFNACDVGQAQRLANFVVGWAPAVLESGASGYIGGLWPLNDASAASFAIEFYSALQQGLGTGRASVAEALRLARARFRANGDPTFLAYVFYGDPDMTLDVVPSARHETGNGHQR